MLAWVLLSLAFAGEPAPEADLEIVVAAEHDVVVARAELHEAVRDLGYLPGVPLGDRTVFLPVRRWKPRVTVWEDGRVKVFGHPLTPLWATPPPDLSVHGLWGTRRQSEGNEVAVLQALEPALDRYETALAQRGLVLRLEEVRSQLEAAWGGTARDGRTLATPEERRAEILAIWLHTADSEAGATVRARVERFAAEVVQQSPHPFPAEEIEAANRRRGFLDELRLSR